MISTNDGIKTMATKDSPLIMAIYADDACKTNYENIRAFIRQ